MKRGVKLACSCKEAVRRITTALSGVGFRVVRGFDLQEALAAQAEECPCPYHGSEHCTCSYTVLLVYGADAAGHPAASPGPSEALRAEGVPSGAHSAGSGHDPARYRLIQLIAVHSHHDETWLTLLSPWGDFPTPVLRLVPSRCDGTSVEMAEPPDAALNVRLLRGLVAAVTEAPAGEGRARELLL